MKKSMFTRLLFKWIYSLPKQPKPKVPEAVKKDLRAKASKLIYEAHRAVVGDL